MRTAWRQSSLAAALIVSLMTLFPATVQSQVLFERKTARQDTLYATVEDCLSLMERIEVQTQRFDTTSIGPVNRVVDTVTTVARQCSQKFTVAKLLAQDSFNYGRTLNAVRLLLKAKRDAEVVALVEGWAAKLPASQDSVVNYLRHEAAGLALTYDFPTRFSLVRQLRDSIEFERYWVWKIRVYGETMKRALLLSDTAEYESAAAWLVKAPDLLSDSMKKSEAYLGDPGNALRMVPKIFIIEETSPAQHIRAAKGYQNAIRQIKNKDITIAKLRAGLETYRAYIDSVVKVDYEQAGPPHPLTNVLAKPIIADYWFPEKPATPRPGSGKVTVVFRIVDNICTQYYCDYRGKLFKGNFFGDNNMPRESRWGKLAQKFPQIEFIGLAKTWGHYGPFFNTRPPEEEARLIDSFHRKVDGFPGFIAVQNTKFWRVDNYDRRKIEEPGPNEEQYRMVRRGMFDLEIYEVRVIAPDGRFIGVPILDFDSEVSMTLFFEELLKLTSK